MAHPQKPKLYNELQPRKPKRDTNIVHSKSKQNLKIQFVEIIPG
jgi:hypothetical protein